jgi:superoxide dismutase, Fe-Mn family
VKHHIVPIPCKPWSLSGISDRLLVSHYEINYGAAVRSLNTVRAQLEAIDLEHAPAHQIRALKHEELATAASVVLHELYFGNLGPGSSGYTGDGKLPETITAALHRDFGGVVGWRREFVALANALAGRSGWVLLCYARGEDRLCNQIVTDDAETMIDAVPILVLDLYEHAYHLEFGANAGAYVDAFLRNVDWATVAERLAGAREGRPLCTRKPADNPLPSISVEELATQLSRGERVQLLDARPRHYFARATDMMAGAVWRDPERIDDWCAELAIDAPVAVYCAYGFYVGCTVVAALRDRGFDARFVRGGLSAWYGLGGDRAFRPGSIQPQR